MIKVPIDKTQSLIDEYKNIKYFCPYPLCRSLFKDIHNDHKIQVVKEGYTYQCIHCGKHFNRSTYEEKSKCGKPYQIHNTLDKTKDEYLEFHIGNLWNEYYTDREIHTITHFSRQLIGKITKEFRDNVIDICTIEEFEKKYLSDLDNKYPLIPWRDLRTHKIRKAFSLGCSVDQIAIILNMGNTTIVNAKRGKYLVEGKIKSDNENYLKEKKAFLKNAEAPISKKNPKLKNRTVITISADGKVRVKGTKEK